MQAAAYAASRMPGCYAAVLKVMEELHMRLPGFRPASMLDFGAGPGTAIWAAQKVTCLKGIADILYHCNVRNEML
jgi:ribosomal protein RSM22 (predicted rRNA methylase)